MMNFINLIYEPCCNAQILIHERDGERETENPLGHTSSVYISWRVIFDFPCNTKLFIPQHCLSRIYMIMNFC